MCIRDRNERLDDSTYTVLEDHAVPVQTFLFLGSYTKYGEFLDGQDGYWYGFSNEANSSGNARMLWQEGVDGRGAPL